MTRRHWSTKARMAIAARHGNACHMCQRPLDERGFDLDHAIPLAIGGEDVEENLRPLCVPCHRLKTKGDATMIAKTRRVEAKHRGAKAPSRNPIPGSRNSRFKKRMDGTVVLRAENSHAR